MAKLSSQTQHNNNDPAASSDSDSEFVNRVVGAPIAPLSKKSIDNLLAKAEEKLNDIDSSDKEKYIFSYKIATLKELTNN